MPPSLSSTFVAAAFFSLPSRNDAFSIFLGRSQCRSQPSACDHAWRQTTSGAPRVAPTAIAFPVRFNGGLTTLMLAASEDKDLVGPDLAAIEVDVEDITGTGDDAKYKRLCEFVRLWAELFEQDKEKSGLTTPVTVSMSHGLADNQYGVQITFKSVRPAFKSLKEERKEEEERKWGVDDDEAKKSKEKKPKKEGGVEVLVERNSPASATVRARRCNMDEDTFVKEMSEKHILHVLKESIAYWAKENKGK